MSLLDGMAWEKEYGTGRDITKKAIDIKRDFHFKIKK